MVLWQRCDVGHLKIHSIHSLISVMTKSGNIDGKQASRQAGKQASRQAGKQASRQAGKHGYLPTHVTLSSFSRKPLTHEQS